MKADKGRRQRCRRIRPGSPGVAQAPIDGVSNCSRAMPATSTSGRAARSDSAPPSDACTSGSLQTAILLHVGRPPDRIAAAGRRKRLPCCHTGDAGTDSQRANQKRRGNCQKKANRTGGCKERLRRRRRNVSITHRSRKRVLRRPWSLLRPPPRAPERNRPESSAGSPVRRPWARAANRWRPPNAIPQSGLVPFENRYCKDQTVPTSEARILSRIARIYVFAHAAQTTHAWRRGVPEGNRPVGTTRVPILTRCVGSNPYDKS